MSEGAAGGRAQAGQTEGYRWGPDQGQWYGRASGWMGSEQGQGGGRGGLQGGRAGGAAASSRGTEEVWRGGARRAMGREEVGVKTNVTSYAALPLLCLSSPPLFPYARHCRRPITYVSRSRSSAPKAFLATAFLTLGHGDATWFYTLERHGPRIGQWGGCA